MQSSSQFVTTNKLTSSFYRPDTFHVTHPTVSKHGRYKLPACMKRPRKHADVMPCRCSPLTVWCVVWSSWLRGSCVPLTFTWRPTACCTSATTSSIASRCSASCLRSEAMQGVSMPEWPSFSQMLRHMFDAAVTNSIGYIGCICFFLLFSDIYVLHCYSFVACLMFMVVTTRNRLYFDSFNCRSVRLWFDL